MTEVFVMDWRSNLFRWAMTQNGRPFAWGDTDCASLTRKALAICFGRELFPDAPRWNTRRGAVLAWKETGGLEPALVQLGAKKTDLNFVRAGDVVCFDEAEERIGHTAVGIWIGNRCLMSTVEGVALAPLQSLPTDSRVYSLWEVLEVIDG